jgi:metallophosphoesterase (TIGR00282 family)
MGTTYRILFLGDIVGKSGRNRVRAELPDLVRRYSPTFTIFNGENAASGIGITPDIAQEFFNWGADAITLGNHAFDKREIVPYLDIENRIVRPANLPPTAPGVGMATIERDGIVLAVINLCGRVFMGTYDDPFRTVDRLIESAGTPHVFIDFHAEATSEKIALAWYVNGRATAVVGTHTHVPTADERILPGGTAAITDVGMCGPIDSVLGVERAIVIQRFLTGMPAKFEVAETTSVISGVVIDVEVLTGRAVAIERVRIGTGH